MRMLLIVAHGSRREASNEEVRALAARLRAEPGTGFDDVVDAFLEVAAPSIPDGLQCYRQRGAHEIVVFPHFLATGRHVVDDIPAAVAAFCQQYPGIAVMVTAHLGLSDLLPRAILRVASDTLPFWPRSPRRPDRVAPPATNRHRAVCRRG
jgi:sirohydrochlorin ferrochelatase